jgi:hypothetical protein
MPFGYLETCTVFEEDDSGFFRWLDNHPDGYFIRAKGGPKKGDLMLHRSACSNFDRSPTVHWTRDSIKICSTVRSDLLDWATTTACSEPELCRTCFG